MAKISLAQVLFENLLHRALDQMINATLAPLSSAIQYHSMVGLHHLCELYDLCLSRDQAISVVFLPNLVLV